MRACRRMGVGACRREGGVWACGRLWLSVCRHSVVLLVVVVLLRLAILLYHDLNTEQLLASPCSPGRSNRRSTDFWAEIKWVETHVATWDTSLFTAI
jgi:hypothetical protein